MSHQITKLAVVCDLGLLGIAAPVAQSRRPIGVVSALAEDSHGDKPVNNGAGDYYRGMSVTTGHFSLLPLLDFATNPMISPIK